MKFSIKEFFSKCYQILRKLRIWWRLRKKSLMENFIFCAVELLLVLVICPLQQKTRLAYDSNPWDSNSNSGLRCGNRTITLPSRKLRAVDIMLL